MKANEPCIKSCLFQVLHKVLYNETEWLFFNSVLVTRTPKQRCSILEVADNVFNAGGRLLPLTQYCQESHYHRTWISCHVFCRLIREKWESSQSVEVGVWAVRGMQIPEERSQVT